MAFVFQWEWAAAAVTVNGEMHGQAYQELYAATARRVSDLDAPGNDVGLSAR